MGGGDVFPIQPRAEPQSGSKPIPQPGFKPVCCNSGGRCLIPVADLRLTPEKRETAGARSG